MILPITLLGDKILRKKVSRVAKVDIKTIELIKNMFETMRNANGIGLAANQVGADKNLFILDISKVEGYEEIKPMVLINPKIIERSEELIIFEEGCLSIPDFSENVERPMKLVVKGQNINGNEMTIEAEGILARCFCHEIDHLNGVLFIDHLSSLKRTLIKNKIKKLAKSGDW